MTGKVPVSILGATGMVGQQLVVLLENHPRMCVREVVASEKNAGKDYADAVQWTLDSPIPSDSARLTVRGPDDSVTSPLVFSCLSADVARRTERRLAAEGHLVVSNASAFRMDGDVPLVIPEINPEALGRLSIQRKAGIGGGLVTNPNCVVAGLALGLAPLHREFGIKSVVVSTLQAVSGAGLPGPPSLSMVDNLIPWIRGEEDKISVETSKILEADITVSASVHRVPVVHGHTMSVFAHAATAVTPAEAIRVWREFEVPESVRGLPSAPDRPLVYHHDAWRPQPRLDRDRGRGMTVTLGRARPCPVLGLVFELCVHNLIRGAAGAALLNAELCLHEGWLR